jgi:dTDP-4-dehydrorhamnose reductase
MLPTPILILGGHGMLGQDMARELTEYNPVIWDREECDITNREQVMQVIEKMKPAIIINTAAYNAVDAAEEEQGLAIAMKVNADGPENIALAAQAIDAIFLHFSTDYVFDGTNKEGYDENAQPNPQSGYARSKRAGEEKVLAVGGKSYIVRTCKLFGQPGVSDASKQSFVDLMLTLAETRDTLDVVDEEYASPTYTPDLAAQSRVLLEGVVSGLYVPGIYHVTNIGACTWYEFAQEIFAYIKKPMTLNPVTAEKFPRPAARPKFSVLLNTKLPQTRSWQEALHAYLDSKK